MGKKIDYNAPVVLSFFFLSLVALFISFLTGGLSNRLLFSVYRAPLANPLTWLRFFGHALGHVGWEHFIGNMMLFLAVGPALEEKYGSRRLLYAILATAFLSGLIYFVFFPGTGLLGASDIVFMMILLSSLSGMREGKIPLTLLLVGVMYFGKEIYGMLFIHDGTANLAHIIGGACGTAIGFVLEKTGDKT